MPGDEGLLKAIQELIEKLVGAIEKVQQGQHSLDESHQLRGLASDLKKVENMDSLREQAKETLEIAHCFNRGYGKRLSSSGKMEIDALITNVSTPLKSLLLRLHTSTLPDFTPGTPATLKRPRAEMSPPADLDRQSGNDFQKSRALPEEQPSESKKPRSEKQGASEKNPKMVHILQIGHKSKKNEPTNAVAACPSSGGEKKSSTEESKKFVEEVRRIGQCCAIEAEDYWNYQNKQKGTLEGDSPSKEECTKLVFDDDRKQQEQRLIWGDRKHKHAEECMTDKLKKIKTSPFGVSIEASFTREGKPTDRYSTDSIRPDIVVHLMETPSKGNVIHIYDLKFPCPPENVPRWGGKLCKGTHQQMLYASTFGLQPAQVTLISPRYP